MNRLFLSILLFTLITIVVEINENDYQNNVENEQILDFTNIINDDDSATMNLIDVTQITNSLNSNNTNLSKITTTEQIRYIIVGIFIALFLLL